MPLGEYHGYFNAPDESMKNIPKKYWVIAILAFLVGLDWYIRAPDARSRELTRIIQARATDKLKAYPYQFQVVKVTGETAFLTTPRNVDVPAFKVIGVLYPNMDTKDPNNPAFIAAQQLLGEVQSEARSIVLAEPGIKEVRWELDREWLRSHFVEIPER